MATQWHFVHMLQGNEDQSTILIEQGISSHALKIHSALGSPGTSKYMAQPTQRSFTGLRRRQDPTLPDIWHSEESTALLVRRSTGEIGTTPMDSSGRTQVFSPHPDGAWGGLGNADDPSSDSDSSYAVSDELDEVCARASNASQEIRRQDFSGLGNSRSDICFFADYGRSPCETCVRSEEALS